MTIKAQLFAISESLEDRERQLVSIVDGAEKIDYAAARHTALARTHTEMAKFYARAAVDRLAELE